MKKQVLDADFIQKMNNANPEIQQVKTTYVNEYGDVMLPNDPRIAKYEQLIHKYHQPDYEEDTIDDILNDYIRKFKIKRDKEHALKQKKLKNQNTILDAFKMLCGIKK